MFRILGVSSDVFPVLLEVLPGTTVVLTVLHEVAEVEILFVPNPILLIVFPSMMAIFLFFLLLILIMKTIEDGLFLPEEILIFSSNLLNGN